VKVIYALAATQEALEEARRRGIWVLKIDRDLVPRPGP
jgi:nitric oxide reductase activation protein